MWDLEKTDSQNLEVQETKNIVRHPEGVQRLLKGELKRFSFFVKSFLGCYCSAVGIKNTATQSYIRLW